MHAQHGRSPNTGARIYRIPEPRYLRRRPRATGRSIASKTCRRKAAIMGKPLAIVSTVVALGVAPAAQGASIHRSRVQVRHDLLVDEDGREPRPEVRDLQPA
jgi:hypothetical protein